MNHRNIYDKYNEVSAIAVETGDYNTNCIKAYHFWREHYLPYLPENKESKIIELGCGLGINVHAIGRLGYTNVSGVEICAGSVELCRKNNLNVIKSDIFSFFESNHESYDVIILHHVLEHFTRDEALILLQEIKDSLSENGTLIIAVPNGWNLFAAGALSNDITHEILYSRNSLNSILQFTGFDTSFFSTNIHTIYDTNKLKYLLKIIFLLPLSFFYQIITKLFLIAQGCIEPETKPNLVAIARIKKK